MESAPKNATMCFPSKTAFNVKRQSTSEIEKAAPVNLPPKVPMVPSSAYSAACQVLSRRFAVLTSFCSSNCLDIILSFSTLCTG